MANCSTTQMAVSGILAVLTIFWSPYALADWTLIDAVGTEGGVMLATFAFLLGAYDLTETVGFVEYPQ